MKKALQSVAILLAAMPVVFAHVGSPNVFYEGRAGAYAVHAIIRPPGALPGAAQVSVRVEQADIRSVSLLPVMWEAGRKGSPQSVAAQRVPGETNLWSAEVWFLYPGSYTVQIGIDGSQGTGDATVPVNVMGTERQQMKIGLRTVLSAFGLVLLLSAVFIVGAVAREGCLERHDRPSVRHYTRGRRAAGAAAVMLAVFAAGGAFRWRKMDLAYRTQGIQKPQPVAATVRSETDWVILELRQAEQSVSLPPWSALVPDHGKLMHLFLIREPALDVFTHLHPIRTDGRTFALEVPALPGGGYQLYGDVTFENGISQTLIAKVTLPKLEGRALMPPPLLTSLGGELFCGSAPVLATGGGFGYRDADDSWHVDQVERPGVSDGRAEQRSGSVLVARLMGGYQLVFENAAGVVNGSETSLHIVASAPDGRAAALQPYMGMLGHAAVRRADGSVFAHLHPSGSFSMAAREVFEERDASRAAKIPSPPTQPTNRVSFPYQFPKTGAYRLWIQVRIAGQVLTGVFDLEIKGIE